MFVNYILGSFCSNMLKTLIAFILLNHVKGENLIVKVDDEITISRKFCSGKLLTFVCTIRTSGYLWTVGTLLSRNEGQIVVGNQLSVGRFTLSAQGSGDGRNSTLRVAAFSGLNGVLIRCEDPGNSINSQTAVITLLDMCPTDISPDLNDDCLSVNVSFTVNNCTQQYIVSISENNNMSKISYRYVPIIYSGEVQNIGRFNLSNLNSSLCSQYYVKVTAIYFDGSNMTCPTISVIQPTTSTNFSTTTEQDSASTTTSIIIVVVVLILVVLLGLVMLVIVRIVILVRKRKKERKKIISEIHERVRRSEIHERVRRSEICDNDISSHYSYVGQRQMDKIGQVNTPVITMKKDDRPGSENEEYLDEDSNKEDLTPKMHENPHEKDNKSNEDKVSSTLSLEIEDEDNDSYGGYSPDDDEGEVDTPSYYHLQRNDC